MAKISKLKEWKPATDENLKSYGSNPAGFQVHIVALNDKGHRIEARYGAGPETMFVDYANFNKYNSYTLDNLERQARIIYSSIRMNFDKEQQYESG